MPCSDSQQDPEDIRAEARAEMRAAMAALRERNNVLARVACDALGKLESLRKLDGLSSETLRWWKEHKEFDRQIKES